MEKQITLGAIQSMYINLFSKWNEIKDQIQLTPKGLYSLINLKKIVNAEMDKMQETVQSFLISLGITEETNFYVPEDKIAEVNNKLAEMNQVTITINYTPIEIKDENCNVPIEVIDVLFDFIEIE